MADQDFNIKVVTTADTTGIRQTESGLAKLQRQQAMFAETARRQAAAAVAPSAAVGGGVIGVGGAAGLTGTAIGLGTIVTLLTSAVTKWKAFNDELDKSVEKMLQSEAKMRALGESILDTQDKMISLRRVAAEPLGQSLERLQKEAISLKTQMSLLDLPRQGEEWKKLNSDLNTVESTLKRVKAGIADAAKEKKSFEISAFEAEAKEAEDKGDTAGAERARKTADALKRGIPLDELRPFEPAPVKAGIGESQALVDQIEKNKQAFVDQNIPKKWELDPTTGGMKEVAPNIKETNVLLKQILDQFR